MSFNTLGKIVWERKLAFLTVFMLIVAGVTAFTMTVTPMYQSQALLMTTLDRAQRQQSQFPDTLRYQLNSQIYIINSEDVLRQAIGEFGAQRLFPEQKQPAAWQAMIPADLMDEVRKVIAPFRPQPSQDQTTDADRALLKVKKRLAVTLEKDSQILSLTFRHEDPKVAEQFLTLVVRDFLQRQADLSGNAAAPAFFRQQASRYRDEYKQASAELSAFAAQHSTYSVSQETELALARRDNAIAALAKTRGSIAEKEAQAATFQNTLTQLRRRISLPSEITGPKQAVPNGNADALTDANKVPSNESPLLLVRVFQETAQSLVNLNSEIVGLRSLEKAQAEAVADVGRKLSDLSSIAAEFNRLKDQLDQVSKVMEAHVGRAAEAQLNADWDASEKLSNVKVAQSATSPTEPVFPPKPLFLALGAVIGVVGGAATCVMLAAISDRRRRSQQRRYFAEEDDRFDDAPSAEPDNWNPSPAMAEYRLRRQAPIA
ncbi:GumC family protein [Bradyrhizobium sp. HKCCYLS20291]|uniref:GumC family protein n=1 Tax=Bradyrhizobium sp. HKCCYLS20291 TaxID=3420766 RepID=UPI003EBA6744